nr:hypothetical protein [Escherichia coli O25b:H4-ST131]
MIIEVVERIPTVACHPAWWHKHARQLIKGVKRWRFPLPAC